MADSVRIMRIELARKVSMVDEGKNCSS